ncbi:hypothetical protein O181_044769 [Austropuccinia psidii MF-1]|uniref:Uncharacterized protein n=1 Tax=Austropuccinia psidii MF-1 TaxID=1389203 RepID=A0A9Q3DKN3_9BASI|nr:hypothetical protein [Austropuccinia psidii MF-1]
MSHHPSFVSLLSRPGFGILNGNEDQHSSSSYVFNRNEDQPSSSSLAPSPHRLIYENKHLYHQPNYNYNDYYQIKSYPDHTYDTESLASSQNNSHTQGQRHAHEIDDATPLQEDDGDIEDISDRVSTPRFEEIDNQKSSGISLTQDGHSQRKIWKKKNACPQCNLPEKFVSNKPQLVMSVLGGRLDLQENKWLEHMKSQILYQHAQDENTGELKLLEIRENKAIKEMELNYQHDIQVENNKYRYAP